MKKKILFFIPSIEEGGVEKNLYLISDYFIKKKLSVEVITCNFDKKRFFNKKIKIIGSKSNFLVNKSRLIKNIICIFYLFVNLLKNNKNTLVFSFQANSAAALISKLTFTRIISRSNSSPSGWTGGFLKRLIYRLSLTLSNNIIVNSKEFKRELTEINIKSNLIYNLNSQKKIKKKLKFFENYKGLKILNIGRLTSQKDQITLIKSLNILRLKKIDFRCCIIGRGVLMKNLKKEILKYKLKKKAILLGYKKEAENYIHTSNLFVLTSRYEGLPNVLIEAQKYNVPIISTNCPTGPKEILLNGKLGDLFEVGDYKKLADKIISFYKKKTKLRKKSLLAKNYFFRFDPNLNSLKYKKLIDKT